tara:strand:+ start:3053 stop:3217 length:165 start_codon:yes stop_codon:yes gene_type:complete
MQPSILLTGGQPDDWSVEVDANDCMSMGCFSNREGSDWLSFKAGLSFFFSTSLS